LDWWQEIQHHARPDITIACVPAMVNRKAYCFSIIKKAYIFLSLSLSLSLSLLENNNISIGVVQEYLLKRTIHSGVAM
jgi:hypothetical protein